jgi:hypothetical protein
VGIAPGIAPLCCLCELKAEKKDSNKGQAAHDERRQRVSSHPKNQLESCRVL